MKGILVVVPCGQRKIWDKDPNRGPTPARDAYIGAPFKVNKKYAAHFAERWVILSAKHGFMSPDFIIPGPYNVTFKDKSTNPISVSSLRSQIQAQKLGRFETVIGLGGKEYRGIIEQAFVGSNVRICLPFAGPRIGKAMQATKLAIELDDPCAQPNAGAGEAMGGCSNAG